MKKLVTVSLFTLLTIFLKAQNLVKNPGFELFFDCPVKIGEFHQTQDWFSVNAGSPELYHRDCDTYLFHDFQAARSGNGHAGLILHCQYKEAIEYIGTELIDSLDAGVDYCVGFYTHARSSAFYISNIGLILQKEHPGISYWGAIRRPFSIRNRAGYISPENAWVEISGVYTAEGGERYLAIGNFADKGQTSVLADQSGVSAAPGWMSYYYIDDVFVYKMPESQTCKTEHASILAPMIDSTVVPKEKRIVLYFDFDQSILKATEIQKLTNFFSSDFHTNDDIYLTAHTDAFGSEAYNLGLSERRALATFTYLKKDLGLSNPIKISFEGELTPISDNNSEEGRAQNRRVEIRLLNSGK